MSDCVRLASADDAARLVEIYGPIVRDTPTSFEVCVPTRDEMAARISVVLPEYPWIVLERDGQVEGYAYATRHRSRAAYSWSVEVAIYVSQEARRGGVGRRLYSVLFRLLAVQGFANAYAGITLPNDASVRLHEAVGFEPIGVFRRIGYKFGGWHDVGWWQRSLAESSGTPARPLTPTEVRPDLWRAALEA